MSARHCFSMVVHKPSKVLEFERVLSHVERHSPIRPDEQDLDTLKAVVEDAKFDFKENGLHIG